MRLRFKRVSGKILVNEKIPNLFPAPPSIKCFILRVARSPKLLVGCRWFHAVALPHELNNTFAVVDLLAQHFAQIPTFSPENFLPDGLITKKTQCVGHELSGAL